MQDTIKKLLKKTDSKIILVVLDGLGGLPVKDKKTELELADTPNMDKLAYESACGLHIPVNYGITPGSGPGHLALFGYDPLKYEIGRGILEVLGVGLTVKKTDICIRGNYSTCKDGVIVDRRAGRISTEKNKEITKKLKENIKNIDNVEVIFEAGMEHRAAIILRFPENLDIEAGFINDTDPQVVGKAPLEPVPTHEKAKKVAEIVKKLSEKVKEVLKDEEKANYLLLRGFAAMPNISTFEESFMLKPVAIANYPMYRGLAKLINMETPELEGTVQDEINLLKEKYNDYDYFFLHVKKVDSYGEDGNFEKKAEQISNFDKLLPQILELKPDVLIITGDHSTPSLMKGHSWHPVPVLMHSPYVLGQTCSKFSERECLKGELGIFNTPSLMPLALAHACKLNKFGA